MAIETPASKAGNVKFLQYQRQVFQSIFPGFTYEFCITSTVVSDTNMIAQEIECVLLDLPDEILVSYMQNAQDDPFTPLSLRNPGRAFSHSEVCQDLDLIRLPFFINHCSKFGIFRGITIGYNYPASRHTFITIDYLGGEANNNWAQFDHTRLSIASFPFALAWLLRQQRLDESELERCFDLLSGFTESKLQNLRKYINAPYQTFADQGKDLGISGGGLRTDLNDTLKKVRSKLAKYCRPNELESTMRLAGLQLHYDFLKMLGDHTQEIVRDT